MHCIMDSLFCFQVVYTNNRIFSETSCSNIPMYVYMYMYMQKGGHREKREGREGGRERGRKERGREEGGREEEKREGGLGRRDTM